MGTREKGIYHTMLKTMHRRRVAPVSGDTLTDVMPQIVWTMLPNGRHEYVNQRYRDYTGLTLAQLQSDRWVYLQFIHPDDQAGNRALRQQAHETGALFEYEQRLRQGQTG